MAEFFEGREKLLEIWFKPPQASDDDSSPSGTPLSFSPLLLPIPLLQLTTTDHY